MADFPTARYHKPVISNTSLEANSINGMFQNVAAGAAAAWVSANRALFFPFSLGAPYMVNLLWWANGAGIAGTTDVGVYTADGTLLLNAGTVTQAGASVIQSAAPTQGATLLTPGSYYMAMSASTVTTATYWRQANVTVAAWQMAGQAQQATAHPLPATFTLAALATVYVPLFGIASQTVI